MPPLKAADLIDFLRRGHRPRADWKLGIEYEQFVTDPQGAPVPYSGPGGVAELLARLAQLTGWKEYRQGRNLLGLTAPDGRAITLEPGAQIEFGSTPCRSLTEAADEVADYLNYLGQIEQEFPVHFVALGAQPVAAPDQIERIPKERYDILEPYLQSTGDLGLWMMKATCGVQVNFDHSDEADAMLKLRTTFALAPVFSAMFANSSVRHGQLSGYASWRGHVWTRTDPARCGIIESLCQPDSTFQDYIEWVLDLPMLFIEREGLQIDMRSRTFRQHLEAGDATEADWESHLSTPFPEVRFRPQLEIRCADSQCPSMTLALAALVQGVYYEPGALQQAWQLTANWSHAERLESWHAAHRYGLAAKLPARHQTPSRRTLLDLARELLDLSVLRPDDAKYLAPLVRLLQDGQSEGELSAELFAGQWNGSIQKLVEFGRCSQAPI
jgi:glutamate--cysteine ligase